MGRCTCDTVLEPNGPHFVDDIFKYNIVFWFQCLWNLIRKVPLTTSRHDNSAPLTTHLYKCKCWLLLRGVTIVRGVTKGDRLALVFRQNKGSAAVYIRNNLWRFNGLSKQKCAMCVYYIWINPFKYQTWNAWKIAPLNNSMWGALKCILHRVIVTAQLSTLMAET